MQKTKFLWPVLGQINGELWKWGGYTSSQGYLASFPMATFFLSVGSVGALAQNKH